MKGKTKTFCRVSSLLLMLLMITGLLCVTPLTVSAAEVTKTEKVHEIAVVFDNSGSMYDGAAWCRAKYAMEIFASMIDYGKDKLRIFPMWEVTTDGSQPASGGSYAPIEIKSKNDINKISNLFTVNPSETPFEPITEANNYLKGTTADEKWLIVLTDGKFNRIQRNDTNKKLSSDELRSRLLDLATGDIKIQYLGFGIADQLQPDEANGFYAKKSTDTSLKNDLIDICNKIFQRSILPGNRLSNGKLKLDLSMKNLVVFVQGANAKIASLNDSSGKGISVSLDSGQRKYSNIKANGYENKAKTDTSLAGQVVTFSACPKGEYTLSYTGTGAENIQVFYEPDVDIDVSFIDSDGKKVDKPEDFKAGEYTVTSKIVDAVTGEDVTSHELLGNEVKLNTYVKTSKDSEYKSYANGSKIVFVPDEKTDIVIEGEYLGQYKISTKDDEKWDWLHEISIKSAELKIEAEVLQSHSWYKLKDHENWKPIKVSITLEGKPLTDEQLANVKLNMENVGELKYRCEPVKGESAYYIYIAQDESGKYIEPKTGEYEPTILATMNSQDQSNAPKDDATVSFDIQTYSWIWKLLKTLAIIAAILALIALWLLHPVLPKVAYVHYSEDEASPARVKSSFAIRGRYIDDAVISGTPKINWKFRNSWIMSLLKPKSQDFNLTDISLNDDIGCITIDNTTYNTDENNSVVDVAGNKVNSIRIYKCEISWDEEIEAVNGDITINKKGK